MSSNPSSDHEWTVHALNIHGVFFERWCQKLIHSMKGWELVSANYPVAVGDHESALDIRAEYVQGSTRLTLLIECKKNNPEFIDWIFFPRYATPENAPTVPCIENRSSMVGVETALKTFTLPLSVLVAQDARETRGSYAAYKGQNNQKTKTSNAAIEDAARQVAIATQSVLDEQRRFNEMRLQDPILPGRFYSKQLLVPAIVTTAHIYTCHFNPSDVDPDKGEIPFDKIQLTKQPYLVFDYPLPRYLMNLPANLGEMDDQSKWDALRSDSLEPFARMQIAVVHSQALSEFATELTYRIPR